MERVGYVKIAPDMGDIKFNESRNVVYCVLNDIKISYKLPPGIAFSNSDDYHKKAIQAAIAFGSSDYLIQGILNKMYSVRGEVLFEKIVEV